MRKHAALFCLLGVSASPLWNCQEALAADSDASALTAGQKEATAITARLNRNVYDQLNFDDERELEFATRG